jgi:hypothetical protein
LGGPLSKLCVTPPFSINFRCQIENQVSDYRLLGASSLVSCPKGRVEKYGNGEACIMPKIKSISLSIAKKVVTTK